MTKDDLITKYKRRWSELNEKIANAKRLKHESTDQSDKLKYESEIDLYASQKIQIEYFLDDLQKLNRYA